MLFRSVSQSRYKCFMEANEELTIMGLGMFIAVHPDESMFDGTCGIPRDKWLRELSEVWDKAGDVERIIDYSVVSKEQDKFGMSATGYFAVLPVFWRQFYAMLMGVMRNYGVALVYLQTRLFLLGYRLNPRDSFVFSCGEYALSLDRDGAGEEFPWGLGCKNPWQDGSRTKISFKDFLEANEELTIMGLGMFIAVHPDDNMFDGTCGIPRDKWLRELTSIS